MKCLFYCIFQQPGPEMPGSLRGVGGRPVYQVTHRRLSAAMSRIAQADLTPDLARVRAYDWVVAAFHRRRSVIPLRYGCVLERESQVVQLLEERAPQYEALLQELEGCVEMGLRVLLPTVSLAAVPPGGAAGGREELGPCPPARIAAPARPGLAYLTARKARYAHLDRWTTEYRQAADRCLARFAGLYVKSKTEGPSPRLPLLSLYFLVPQGLLESFRQAFRNFNCTEPARLLLSGPWPPYNFVTPGPCWPQDL
jgi:hypothetical protein